MDDKRSLIEKLERLAAGTMFPDERDAALAKARELRLRYGIFGPARDAEKRNGTGDVPGGDSLRKDEKSSGDDGFRRGREGCRQSGSSPKNDVFVAVYHVRELSGNEFDRCLAVLDHVANRIGGLAEWRAEKTVERKMFFFRTMSVTLHIRFSALSMSGVLAMRDLFFAMTGISLSD